MVPDTAERLIEDSAPPTAPNKGYSIWSLLVIMTLLAVWMAIPRKSDHSAFMSFAFFLLWHQVTFWALLALIIWVVTGKRRGVGWVFVAILVITWFPLFALVLECALTGDTRFSRVVSETLGMHRSYGILYQSIQERFGY